MPKKKRFPPSFTPGHSSEPVSETLEKMADHYRYHQAERLTIDELLHSLRHRGFALLMLILVLPNCVPVPIPPGGSTLFSIPLFFIALQMIWGRHQPWMPAWLRQKSMARDTIDKVIRLANPRLRWVEKFLRPRMQFTHTISGERFVGVMWLIFAISIAVPLPMTNFVPGIGTLVMALGMLGRDGVIVSIGAMIGLLGVAFTVALLTLGAGAVASLVPFLSVNL